MLRETLSWASFIFGIIMKCLDLEVILQMSVICFLFVLIAV